MATTDDWITVNQAALLIGYHPEHIRELIREKRIKAHKFSIVWQVDRESLLAYVEKVEQLGKKRGRKPER